MRNFAVQRKLSLTKGPIIIQSLDLKKPTRREWNNAGSKKQSYESEIRKRFLGYSIMTSDQATEMLSLLCISFIDPQELIDMPDYLQPTYGHYPQQGRWRLRQQR